MRFLFSGGLGATVDFGLLLVGTRILGWQPEWALLLSGSCALLTVFLANKYFTFRRHDTKAATEAWKFLMVYGTSACLNYGLSLFFVSLGLIEVVAKALAVGILMFVNYLFLQGFVFRRRGMSKGNVTIA